MLGFFSNEYKGFVCCFFLINIFYCVLNFNDN